MAEKKKPQSRTRKQRAPQDETPQAEAPPAETTRDGAQPETPQAEAPQAEAPQAEAPQAVTAPEGAQPEAPQAEVEASQAEAEVPQAEAEVPQGEAEAPQGEAAAPRAEVEETDQGHGTEQGPQAETARPEAAEGAAAAEMPQPQAAEPESPQPEAAKQQPETSAAVEASAGAQASERDQEEGAEEAAEPAPRVKPSVPGAHLEVDIVPEGVDPLGRGEEEYEDRYAIEEEPAPAEAEEQEEEEAEEVLIQPIASAAIDLAAGARYRATGKRKTAIARVTLRPGNGTYVINGRTLEEHFPRMTLQRNIRQPLETVGYHERMDVVARLQGGGISAQAGALRHGVSRALLEADPNLRGELKRRGFLTRDSRAKERKKAGLKKARKRPQFSKR